MLLLIKDTLGSVHIVDLPATEERNEGLPTDNIVVSACTRDVVTSISEAEPFTGDTLETVRDCCEDCKRALSRGDTKPIPTTSATR